MPAISTPVTSRTCPAVLRVLGGSRHFGMPLLLGFVRQADPERKPYLPQYPYRSTTAPEILLLSPRTSDAARITDGQGWPHGVMAD